MANPEKPSDRPSRGASAGGVGQSGYAAGRPDPDPALERNVTTQNDAQRGAPDAGASGGPATDDRFTGRGGTPSRDKRSDERDEPVPARSGRRRAGAPAAAPDDEDAEGEPPEHPDDRDRPPAEREPDDVPVGV